MDRRVRAVVRVRPFLPHEANEEGVKIGNKSVELLRGGDTVRFEFDGCYPSDTTQNIIYENEVSSSLDQVFRGCNVTVFAYGITGAGKTHTMQGTETDPGVIPRVADHILREKEKLSNQTKRISVMMSYFEIYNEKVFDLLKPKDHDLQVRQDQHKNIFIAQLAEAKVDSKESFDRIYNIGINNRRTAPTALNNVSSRSHAILMLKIVTKDVNTKEVLTSKLHLIDLAGSEDNRQTANKGMRMTESTNINTSLFVLGKVVNALNDNCSRVPYRDSKLTRILQDSLGGKSQGIIIANIAPGAKFFSETLRTLNFASKSRKVVNRVVVNSMIDKAELEAEGRRKKLEEWRKQREGISVSGAPKRTSNGASKKDLDDTIRRHVDEELRKRMMLAPSMREQRVFDEKMQKRLERLERALADQEASAKLHSSTNAKSNQKRKRVLSSKEQSNTSKQPKKNHLKNPVMEDGDEEDYLLVDDGNEESILMDDDEEWLPEEEDNCQKRRALHSIEKRGGLPRSSSETTHALSFLTPNTKRRTAKEFITQGRMQEVKGNNANALALYIQANDLLPDMRDDLDSRISKLQQKVQASCSTNSHAGKENAVNQREDAINEQLRVAHNTTKVLKVLNHGDVKQLLQLHGIGKKRAELIVQHRESQPFHQLSDLRNIFGEKQVQAFLRRNVQETC